MSSWWIQFPITLANARARPRYSSGKPVRSVAIIKS